MNSASPGSDPQVEHTDQGQDLDFHFSDPPAAKRLYLTKKTCVLFCIMFKKCALPMIQRTE